MRSSERSYLNATRLRPAYFSADVQMRLYVEGHELEIAQLGPDFLVLKTPIDLGAADAEIHMTIDDVENRWPVYLPEGLSAGNAVAKLAGRRRCSP